MLFEPERKAKPSTGKRTVQYTGAVTVFQFDVLKSPAVCSGRRLLFAAFWYRPQQ